MLSPAIERFERGSRNDATGTGTTWRTIRGEVTRVAALVIRFSHIDP